MSTMEHAKTSFPRELLSRTKRERREYFRDYTVPHTRLRKVCTELISAVLDTSDASLIFLAGPTGVGKTTLIRFLEVKLTEHLLTELEGDRGRLPFSTFEVPAPETSLFPWKGFYRRALAALDEPLIEHKIGVPARPEPNCGHSATSDLSEPKGHRSESVEFHGNSELRSRNRVLLDHIRASAKVKISGRGTDELRLALESALIHRRPLVSILDEGQHLMKIANGRKLRDQLELIKSLANMSGVPHLLVGTYDLIPFLDLSGQLSRRSTIIHLPRYLNTAREDAVLFANVVHAFQRHLPLADEPDLLGQVEYLYQHTLGCVGVLKNWLGRALNVALDEDALTVTNAHLKKRALKPKQCRQMLSDARKGEDYFADDDTELALLQKELGMSSTTSSGRAVLPSDSTGENKSVRKGRPFQRKPGRDPVGGKEDHAS